MLFRRTFLRNLVSKPKMSKRHLESYSHLYAKKTVGSWLRKKVNSKSNWILEDVPNMSKNAKIFYEYPICKNTKGETIGLVNNVNSNSNDIWNDYLVKASANYLPTYRNFKHLELIPICIFDVAVVDNGKVKIVFEIKYKNPVSEKKKKIIQNYKNICGMECYEILALDVLDKVRPPKKIDFVAL